MIYSLQECYNRPAFLVHISWSADLWVAVLYWRDPGIVCSQPSEVSSALSSQPSYNTGKSTVHSRTHAWWYKTSMSTVHSRTLAMSRITVTLLLDQSMCGKLISKINPRITINYYQLQYIIQNIIVKLVHSVSQPPPPGIFFQGMYVTAVQQNCSRINWRRVCLVSRVMFSVIDDWLSFGTTLNFQLHLYATFLRYNH